MKPMERLRVVLHPVHPPGVDAVLANMQDVELLRPTDTAAVVDALSDRGQVLVTHTWSDKFLTPSLRWIAGTGAGVEEYALDELSKGGGVLTTAGGVHAACVAEHAFALMLACTRRLGESVRNMTDRRWLPLVGDEVGGKRLLIVGMGRIGEEIARRARAWALSVARVKRNPTNYTGCLTHVWGPNDIRTLCGWPDICIGT